MKMNKLRDCYNHLKDIFNNSEFSEIEPYASVELVERYRQYWKPEQVRVLLLAESHVFTTDLDRKIQFPTNIVLNGAPIALNDYPTEYAKFVYCLAYGEKQLTQNPAHPKGGTLPFWKIFYSCNKQVENKLDFVPLLSKTKYEQRISNKIHLLNTLKSKGIWLVDASIIALYKNRQKPKESEYKKFIHCSWEGYTKNVVEESRPEKIIVIGKGVAGVLENDLKNISNGNYSVIAQPNAWLSAEQHLANYIKYYTLCHE